MPSALGKLEALRELDVGRNKTLAAEALPEEWSEGGAREKRVQDREVKRASEECPFYIKVDRFEHT